MRVGRRERASKTVTRALLVTASSCGRDAANATDVTWDTWWMSAGDLYARQYRPSAVSRSVRGAYRFTASLRYVPSW